MSVASSTSPPPPVAAPSPLASIRVIAGDIKLAHSVFAMPFAVLAAFMAAAPGSFGSGQVAHMIDWRRFGWQLLLIVVAMVFARTVAMLANRWLDREIDARNPRTAKRALPSGQLPPTAAVSAMMVCAMGFMLVCCAFGWVHGNWWPAMLGLPVLGWISAYGWFKRFTALCHVYLGSSLAISPIAAAIAIDPHALGDQGGLWLISGMVLCWVAGFDIIYSLQDVEIDRAQGLHSMPSRLGVPGAMLVSRGLHAAAVGCLITVVLMDERLGWVFGVGVGIAGALLLVEHLTVARWGRTKMALTFFTLNGVISCVIGLLGILDIVA